MELAMESVRREEVQGRQEGYAQVKLLLDVALNCCLLTRT